MAKKKSTVNKAGNYTKPGMRKRIFNKIMAGTKGTKVDNGVQEKLNFSEAVQGSWWRLQVMVRKLNKVAKALGKASKLHKKQSNIIKKHIKEMKSYGKKKRS